MSRYYGVHATAIAFCAQGCVVPKIHSASSRKFNLEKRARPQGDLNFQIIWKNGPGPWEIRTFRGHVEVNVGNGSGI